MLQTEHYQLSQWDFEDQIVMADFNNDNTKIDAALHGLAEETAGKADSGTVNTLSAAVSQKAEQSALAAEQTARQNADSAEQAARIAADSVEKAAREAADAALDKRAGAQFIRTETMTEASDDFVVSLKDINWGDWREVHLVFQTEDTSVQCSMEFNGSSTMHVESYLGPRWHIITCPCFAPTLPLGGFILPFNRGYGTFCSGSPFQKVTSLSISTYEGSFLPGTTLTIWGVK